MYKVIALSGSFLIGVVTAALIENRAISLTVSIIGSIIWTTAWMMIQDLKEGK